ncbi:cytosine permease [Acidithiobacillus montserratensis]|uniref:Cytosine permease n=1 Tax=Acidithiobacillus montserratensis TaxID=2729135 RepID=A0ACD5HEL8_9PROT|nr:cytosine permease [Acidithiobacillus montserratensis]MBU2747961.1 thiamine permease [Acidithiobacillus montserratensis]
MNKTTNAVAGETESHKVETLGVAPVPDSARTMRPGMLFLIWALASASATTPVIGLLLNGIGLRNFVWIVILALFIGLIPAVLMAHMGRQVPVISMIMARRTFGIGGATVLALMYTIVGAGWFGLNTDVGGKILETLFPGYGILWYILLGALQIFLVFFGMELLEKFYKYTALIFIMCYMILAYYLFTQHPFSMPIASEPVHWGKDIDLVLSFSLLAWAYDFPTVTRFCSPTQESENIFRQAIYAFAPATGVMTAVLLMGILGLIALQMTGDWNIALLGKDLPFWGEVSAIGVILAIAHTNAMNLYPAVTKLLAVVNTANKPGHLMQPVIVVILGVFATFLAIVGILNYIEGFLSLLGSFLFPFTFILIIDWFYYRRYTENISLFYQPARRWQENISWPAPWAISMLIFGILLAQIKIHIFSYIFYYIPWQVSSALITGAIYYMGLNILEHRQRQRGLA